MKTKHNDWKVLPLFTTAIIASIFSSALLNAATSAQTATISELTIEERLIAVREYIKQGSEGNTNLPAPLPSSTQDNPEADSKDKQLSWRNWANWPNWRNWSKWGNWPNWAKWNNWGNYWRNF